MTFVKRYKALTRDDRREREITLLEVWDGLLRHLLEGFGNSDTLLTLKRREDLAIALVGVIDKEITNRCATIPMDDDDNEAMVQKLSRLSVA